MLYSRLVLSLAAVPEHLRHDRTTTMDLYLTNHANVRNTNFCNAAGQVIYRSITPGSLLSAKRLTIVNKIVPNKSPKDMIDRFTELASIEWHALTPSILTYGGYEMLMKEFMPSKGILGQYRVFTAPGDGRSFRWKLGSRRSTLQLNDDSKTLVARSHRSNIGIFTEPRQARLEIFPHFEHLADIILVTYIYVEKLRKDRERNS